jgi:hypothetical protein
VNAEIDPIRGTNEIILLGKINQKIINEIRAIKPVKISIKDFLTYEPLYM